MKTVVVRLFIRKRKGFTLIELLTVIAIISILVAVGVPKYVELLEKANLAATLGNLATIRSALSIYHATYLGYPQSIDPAVDLKFQENLFEVPYVKSKYPFGQDSPYGNSVYVTNIAGEIPIAKSKGWFFNRSDGKVYINSIANDIKGNIYNSY